MVVSIDYEVAKDILTTLEKQRAAAEKEGRRPMKIEKQIAAVKIAIADAVLARDPIQVVEPVEPKPLFPKPEKKKEKKKEEPKDARVLFVGIKFEGTDKVYEYIWAGEKEPKEGDDAYIYTSRSKPRLVKIFNTRFGLPEPGFDYKQADDGQRTF